jgi:hypothetical protein
MDSKVSEAELSVYERMQDAMIPFVKQHIVSIAAFYNGELRHHATGTLVQFSDHHFLVTAAHAIEDFDKGKTAYRDIQLLIDNGNSNDLVPLYGNYHATQTVRDRENPRLLVEGERDDLWDIGLWELDRQTVDALTTKRFLNRHNISLTSELTTGAYFLAGCPCKWAKADTAARSASWKWIRYISHPYPEWAELPNFDQRFHMALCLGEEDPQLPKDLTGISGCPIWKLSEVPVKEDWNVNQVQLVAVQTCIYQKKPRAIRGTTWQCVLRVLVNMHPEIRESFKLWLPGQE